MKSKTYRYSDAVSLVAVHGFPVMCDRPEAAEENRVVTLHTHYLTSGAEIVDFRLAFGKYRGQAVGRAYKCKADIKVCAVPYDRKLDCESCSLLPRKGMDCLRSAIARIAPAVLLRWPEACVIRFR